MTHNCYPSDQDHIRGAAHLLRRGLAVFLMLSAASAARSLGQLTLPTPPTTVPNLPPIEGPVWPPGEPDPGPCIDAWCGPGLPPWSRPMPDPGPGGPSPCLGVWCGPGDPPWLSPSPDPGKGPPMCAGLWCGTGSPPWLQPAPPPEPGPTVCMGAGCDLGPPPGYVPPQRCGASQDSWLGVPGHAGTTSQPVDLAYGHKKVEAIDLTVALPGQDFSIVRSYTSKPDVGGDGMVGHHWTLNVFNFIVIGTHMQYRRDCDGMCRLLSTGNRYVASGPTAQYIEQAQLPIDGTNYAVWRFIEPGQWQADYYANENNDPCCADVSPALYGLPLQYRDAYGNTRTFTYTDYSIPPVAYSARLNSIYLNGTTSQNCVAQIQFSWLVGAGEPSATYGRLGSIDVIRDGVTTQRVEYKYKKPGSYHSAVGTDGDLVQVVQRVRVDTDWDGGTSPDWHVALTQYRYHGGLANEAMPYPGDLDGDGFIETGNAHQLKAVLLPQQIEHAVQRTTDPECITSPKAIESMATCWLGKPDNHVVFTEGGDKTLIGLAAKVIAQYEDWVQGDPAFPGRARVQFVQTACGCGGAASQGLKLEYTHVDYPSPAEGQYARTLKVVESRLDDTQPPPQPYVPYRTRYYDSIAYNVAEPSRTYYYLANSVVEEDLGGGNYRRWVQHFEYHPTDRTLAKVMFPSTTTEGFQYQPLQNPGCFNRPCYAPWINNGLVIGYAYTSEKRVSEVRVRKGNDPALSAFDILTRVTYGDPLQSNERSHLPKKIERFRTPINGPSPNPPADGVEVVELTYAFHAPPSPSDAIRWVQTKLEAETVAENGPAGANYYYVHEFYDTAGRNHWSRLGDDVLIRRLFTDNSGDETLVEINAAGPPTGTLPPNGSFAGRNGDGGSVTVIYAHDLLGRVTLTSGPNPSDVKTRFVREMRPFAPERPGIKYFAETVLPHNFSEGAQDKFAGAARVTWFDAAGEVIGVSTYSLTQSGTYDYDTLPSLQYVFALGAEQSRATVQQKLSGLVESVKNWHSLALEGETGGIYTRSFQYDTLGRVKETVDANLTVTKQCASGKRAGRQKPLVRGAGRRAGSDAGKGPRPCSGGRRAPLVMPLPGSRG